MIFDEDRNNRRQKLAWYGLTMVAVIAIVLLNSDRNIVKLDQVETNNSDAALVEGSVGRMTPMQPKPIEWISVLGERNSGTRWLYE